MRSGQELVGNLPVYLAHGMVSLLDVKKFYGAAFLELHAHLARLQGACQVASGSGRMIDAAMSSLI